jgi:hypothetical protein
VFWAGVVLGACGILSSSGNARQEPTAGAAGATGIIEDLRVRRLTVVGADGAERIRLLVHPNGSAAVAFVRPGNVEPPLALVDTSVVSLLRMNTRPDAKHPASIVLGVGFPWDARSAGLSVWDYRAKRNVMVTGTGVFQRSETSKFTPLNKSLRSLR